MPLLRSLLRTRNSGRHRTAPRCAGTRPFCQSLSVCHELRGDGRVLCGTVFGFCFLVPCVTCVLRELRTASQRMKLQKHQQVHQHRSAYEHSQMHRPLGGSETRSRNFFSQIPFQSFGASEIQHDSYWRKNVCEPAVYGIIPKLTWRSEVKHISIKQRCENPLSIRPITGRPTMCANQPTCIKMHIC